LHVTFVTSLFSALERHVGFRRFINAWIIIIIIKGRLLQVAHCETLALFRDYC